MSTVLEVITFEFGQSGSRLSRYTIHFDTVISSFLNVLLFSWIELIELGGEKVKLKPFVVYVCRTVFIGG